MSGLFSGRIGCIRNLLSRRFNPNTYAEDVTHLHAVQKRFDGARCGFSSSPRVQVLKKWDNYHGRINGLLSSVVTDKRYSYDVNAMTNLPKPYNGQLATVSKLKAFGISPLLTHYANPVAMVQFAAKYLLSYRFLFIYMARTAFQAVRPLLAFCVFGEIMKLILANISGGIPAFFFSFVLAFEVLYFFLQCYISYTFLTMFFTVMF